MDEITIQDVETIREVQNLAENLGNRQCARNLDEYEAGLDNPCKTTAEDNCPGRFKCHGPAGWCPNCGDVDLVCDDPACHVHDRGAERQSRLDKAQREVDLLTNDLGTAVRERDEAKRAYDRWDTGHPVMVPRKSN